jgi:hypothetical protein
MRTLYLALAVAAMATGATAGFASAQDEPQDNGPDGSYDEAYSSHWFSPSGYGPNDTQIEETRALNNEQLQNGGRMPNPALDSASPSDDDQADDQADDRADDDADDDTSMPPQQAPAPAPTY